jgi:hypothetical protein
MSVTIDNTKTPMANLFALVNAGNGTSLTQGTKITLDNMQPAAGPNGENTKVTANPIAGQNITGSKDLFYNRIGMKGSQAAPAQSIHVTRTSTLAQIQAAIVSGWGLIPTEVQQVSQPTYMQPSLNVAANPNSLIYQGVDTINLIWDDAPAGTPYGNVYSGDDDDGYHVLTPPPFDFYLFGQNLRTQVNFGVDSNSFITTVQDTTYDQSTQATPAHWSSYPAPAILIGSSDRSLQNLYAGWLVDGSGNVSYKIRYEGHNNYTGTGEVAGSPDMVWEVVFYPDGSWTLYATAPVANAGNIDSSAPTFLAGNWILMDGTNNAVHAYNGAQDTQFTIPIALDHTFKFVPGNATGTTFSCTQIS